MVRLFQLAIRRAGVFVVLLLTAWCKYLLACREGPLSSTHPVEKASNDGAAPYWMEAAQLEAGGSHPMKLQGLLPLSDETPGAPSYANQSELRTGKLPRHVLRWGLVTPLECPLHFALRFEIRIYLPLDGLPSQAKSHLPCATGFKPPVASPSPLLLSVVPVPSCGSQKLNLADRGSESRTPLGACGEVVRAQPYNPLPGYNSRI